MIEFIDYVNDRQLMQLAIVNSIKGVDDLAYGGTKWTAEVEKMNGEKSALITTGILLNQISLSVESMIAQEIIQHLDTTKAKIALTLSTLCINNFR